MFDKIEQARFVANILASTRKRRLRAGVMTPPLIESCANGVITPCQRSDANACALQQTRHEAFLISLFCVIRLIGASYTHAIAYCTSLTNTARYAPKKLIHSRLFSRKFFLLNRIPKRKRDRSAHPKQVEKTS